MTIKTEDLLGEAQRLGFSLAGITRPAPPPHYSVYETWLASGRQAAMRYLETPRARAVRADPHQILPDSLSILSVGIRYPDPRLGQADQKSEPVGRVAAYAWGDDYHEIIPGMLQQLLDRFNQRQPELIHTKIYTDTGPILERDLAQQAGLGWAGKNTCLISPQQGSYFLLAEAFIDAELEPTLPIQHDYCGSCRRCIEACPTQCILDDRTIDSGRCISYLTIENKGEIPAELRPLVGNWVFGCDICQMVCPWNERFTDLQQGTAFLPRPEIVHPNLKEDLHLTPQEFNRKFKSSPVQRARRRGYLRNICVVLGNQPDPGFVPDLQEILQEESEPLVRAHAAWALSKIGGAAAHMALDQALKREEDSLVQKEILAGLANQ